MRFDSRMKVVSFIPPFSQDIIKAEKMFFSAERWFVEENCGLITREFLDNLSRDWDDCIIDSRVHMLMPGWYPCIPGWHHDDVPREREDGQPNYRNPSYRSEHIACVIGDASLTQFIDGPVDVDEVPIGKTIYREWDSQINHQIMVGEVFPKSISEGDMVAFDWQTFHRGMPATKSGWRLFIRASRFTNRKPTNEIRQQTQVYISPVNKGW